MKFSWFIRTHFFSTDVLLDETFRCRSLSHVIIVQHFEINLSTHHMFSTKKSKICCRCFVKTPSWSIYGNNLYNPIYHEWVESFLHLCVWCVASSHIVTCSLGSQSWSTTCVRCCAHVCSIIHPIPVRHSTCDFNRTVMIEGNTQQAFIILSWYYQIKCQKKTWNYLHFFICWFLFVTSCFAALTGP